MVTLITGPPETASFSRFVLPFGYRLEAWKEPPEERELRFAPDQVPADSPRREYLTPETAEVLFDRARWLRLQSAKRLDEPFVCFNLWNGREKVPVELLAPRLVLFEAGSAAQKDLLCTGFLIFDAYFPAGTVARLEDLLLLNEQFRYWKMPFVGHATEEPCPYEATLGGSARKVIAAQVPGDDYGLYGDRWQRLLELPIMAPDGAFSRLCPDDFLSDARSFVWTAAVVAGGAGALGGDPLAAGEWVRLLNVDKPPEPGQPIPPATAFEAEWARDRTYRRWQHYGTLYGFNLHSGAMLSGPPPEDPPIVRHFGEMYFDQVLLLLYLRVGCFRFSRELAEISARARDDQNSDAKAAWTERFRDIRWNFALFANLYQYPLLSNQQQGIEMYSLARGVMDVGTLFDELEEQIAASHEFVEMTLASEEAESAKRLTVVATAALAGALATGFLGMNIVSEGIVGGRPSWQGAAEWGVFLVTLSISAYLLKRVIRHSRWLDRKFGAWAGPRSRGRK